MRRKQTSIRFSRSALPHRYLRSISWISWVHRPQPSTSWVFSPVPQLRPRRFSAAVPIPQGRNSCAPATATQKIEQLLSNLSPRITFFPSFAHLSRVVPLVSLCPQPFARAASDPSAAGPPPAPHVAFCGLPTNKKMRARGITPRTRSKKRRLLAQENTRRHAWLSRSCFGRKNLFIDGPHSLVPFFLSPFLQRKRKKKTEANSAGSNTSLGLTSFVLTMYAIGPSRLVR